MDGEAAPFDPDRGDAAGVPDAWRPAVGVPDAVAGLDLIRRGAALVQGAPLWR